MMGTNRRRYSPEFDRMLTAAFTLAADTLGALHGARPVAPAPPAETAPPTLTNAEAYRIGYAAVARRPGTSAPTGADEGE